MSQDNEALAAYEKASQREEHGEGAAAIPEYERALALGLPSEERCAALLGLGGALRHVGRPEEAVKVLRAAVDEFPEHAALRAFLALALHSQGDGRQAMVTLLDLVNRYAPVGPHLRSLSSYRDALARTPAPAEGWEQLVSSLTRREFAQTFPMPFLIEIGGRLRGGAAQPPVDEETQVGRRVEAMEEADKAAQSEMPLVLALRKVATAVPSAITLGRSSSNDIVIRDSLVSKVHAFFRSNGNDGRWELADAGSRNGTWVSNRKLDSKTEAIPVRSGDVLAFGRLAFFFVDAAGLWDRLHKRAQSPRSR